MFLHFCYHYQNKFTQPRPQVFSVNGSIIYNFPGLLMSSVQWWQNSSKFGRTVACYDELICLWFQPIRKREIFWVNVIIHVITWSRMKMKPWKMKLSNLYCRNINNCMERCLCFLLIRVLWIHKDFIFMYFIALDWSIESTWSNT